MPTAWAGLWRSGSVWDGAVVVLDVVDQLDWRNDRVRLVTGDARNPDVASRAAEAAEDAAR